MSLSLLGSAGLSAYAVASVSADRLDAACAALVGTPSYPTEYVETYANTFLDRASILAATLALQKFPPGQLVTLHVICRRVFDAVTSGALMRWRDEGWKARVGKKPVKDNDLWKHLLEEMTQRDVQVRLGNLQEDACLARCFRAAEEALRSHATTNSSFLGSLRPESKISPADDTDRLREPAAKAPQLLSVLRKSWRLESDVEGRLRLHRKPPSLTPAPSTTGSAHDLWS
jgi:ribonuclease HI